MKSRSIYLRFLLYFSLFFIPFQYAQSTTIQQFNLSDMTNNADKIFRGTVVSIEPGVVAVGGGELQVTTYTLKVNELIKGKLDQTSPKVTNLVTVKMLGTNKRAPAINGVRFVGGFKSPQLNPGNEYLLFTTKPSAVGLSMTVGVGQGIFSFKDGSFVRNEANNAGLFRGMTAATEFPQSGPVDYNQLVAQIESLLRAGR